ncbi:MAG: ECF-type sigma factor [Vicinamibacteria bacterium]
MAALSGEAKDAVTAASRLLASARAGDEAAARGFFALVYDDLRRLAGRHVRAARLGPGATSLVHEVFLRLARRGDLPFTDRAHFFAVASRAMRQILLDDVRARVTDKRGGGAVALDVADLPLASPAATVSREELLTLDDALTRLASDEPRLSETVEWHFFGGLTFGEIAEARGVSERTVLRDWRTARALLHTDLGNGPAPAVDGR